MAQSSLSSLLSGTPDFHRAQGGEESRGLGYATGSGAELCCGGEEQEAPKGQKEYKSSAFFPLRFLFSSFSLFFFFVSFFLFLERSERPLRQRCRVGTAEVRESRLLLW